MQASIACVLGLVTCQRNIHIWEIVAPSPVTGWKLPSLHSRSWTSRIGLKLIFFDISLFKRLPPPCTFYKYIVAVKATIDKQSPHSKLLLKSGFFFSKQALPVIFVVVEVLRDTTVYLSCTSFGNSRTLASFSYSVTFITFVHVLIRFWSNLIYGVKYW